MAFAGTGVTTNYGKYTNRVTGLSLAGGAAGIIGNDGDGGADYTLPATFPAISTSTIVLLNRESMAGVNSLRLSITKAGARITITNDDGVNATGNLEIIIMSPHSITS